MTATAGITAETGTMFLVLELGPPWPSTYHQAILQQAYLLDGVYTLSVNSLGQIIAEITALANNTTRRVVGCPLLADVLYRTTLGVTWDTDRMRIYANGDLVGSTDPADDALASLRLTSKKPTAALHDFTQKNERCVSKRSGRLRGLKPKPGRKLETTEQMFGSLRETVSTIKDLRQLILDGKHHHVRSIAGAIRNLIADNKTMPLLQRCAAVVEAPLIIYTVRNPTIELPPMEELVHHISFDASPDQTERFSNPVDLDLWLELTAGTFNRQRYTNHTLFLAIAHSVGSHSDPNVHPTVETMRALIWQSSHRSGLTTLLASYLSDLAAIIITLADRLLSAREANQ